jgi:hypothetical protein
MEDGDAIPKGAFPSSGTCSWLRRFLSLGGVEDSNLNILQRMCLAQVGRGEGLIEECRKLRWMFVIESGELIARQPMSTNGNMAGSGS